MKEYDCKSIEQILDKINEEDVNKLEFAEYFLMNHMGIESNEDSEIVIGPLSTNVMLSLIASILIKWESI